MKKLLIFLIPALIYFSHADCQQKEYAREIIKELSSEKYHGRGYVKGGMNKSASFIKKEFSRKGLKAFSDSYFQEFSIPVNTFPGKLKLSLDDHFLCPGTDYIVDPYSPSLSGSFPVLMLRREELENESFILKILGESKGKVLIIDERGFEASGEKSKEVTANIINALKYDPKLPHVATIILTDEKLNWGIATAQAARPVIAIKNNADLNEEFKTVRIKLKAKLIHEKEIKNIIAYTEGTSAPDTFLVITAHYDHLGMMGKKVYFPGANDNASGIAMMLSLADYFAANPHDYSIVFMALTAEEAGILGAKYFVQNPLFPLNKIKFLINFDLAGTGNEGIKVVNGSVYSQSFERLNSLNSELKLLPAVESRGEACISDHCAFYNKGVPSFYIYTLGGSKAYHDPFDRPENLPLDEFEDYFRLMIKFIEGF